MNLVDELQNCAESSDVLTVLRKAKRLSSKLGRNDISTWLQSEMDGYGSGQSVPTYRMIQTTFAYNSNGYIPAGYGFVKSGVEDLQPMGIESPVKFRESISVILMLIDRVNNGNKIYNQIDRYSKFDISLRNMFHFHPIIADQISLLIHLNEFEVKAIPDRIKDTILDWACALERAGVTGEGMSFSEKEKGIAHQVTINISGSQISQLTSSGNNYGGAK